ncbi:hypothetical protein K432DRAFT_382397 [Lepidopterella palustris CBS 459.81]|uniref:Uncharacterized protein n=1 Tax=Lepidopterella palustris CBS 459.81 TaxID=1314670 RepID=A0A8E2EA75_9PEZI|nr:hypothetical protein K432DRAFT_382397 [Lepidopterella palustris CBS 459.81]
MSIRSHVAEQKCARRGGETGYQGKDDKFMKLFPDGSYVRKCTNTAERCSDNLRGEVIPKGSMEKPFMKHPSKSTHEFEGNDEDGVDDDGREIFKADQGEHYETREVRSVRAMPPSSTASSHEEAITPLQVTQIMPGSSKNGIQKPSSMAAA